VSHAGVALGEGKAVAWLDGDEFGDAAELVVELELPHAAKAPQSRIAAVVEPKRFGSLLIDIGLWVDFAEICESARGPGCCVVGNGVALGRDPVRARYWRRPWEAALR